MIYLFLIIIYLVIGVYRVRKDFVSHLDRKGYVIEKNYKVALFNILFWPIPFIMVDLFWPITAKILFGKKKSSL
jgi:hypothetical protein